MTNNVVKAAGLTDKWTEVRKKMIDFLTNREVPVARTRYATQRFIELALGLAKYDYYGAPSNWDPKFKHWEFIERWTLYAVDKEDEHYSYDVADILETYRTGGIPDGYNLMVDYCC